MAAEIEIPVCLLVNCILDFQTVSLHKCCKSVMLKAEVSKMANDDAKQQGRKGLVLTCKERLIPYYANFGFRDEGVSDKSTHGNVVWHQMRLVF